MSPRPILKRQLPCTSASSPFPFASCPAPPFSPHVHFPPTPILTSTHPAHSPSTYDRAPILVSPNSCALPHRNEREYEVDSLGECSGQAGRLDDCRGRTMSGKSINVKGSYFHPRAYEASGGREASPDATYDAAFGAGIEDRTSDFTDSDDEFYGMFVSICSAPTLVPDLSSSSSDESDSVTTPPDLDVHASSSASISHAAAASRRHTSHIPLSIPTSEKLERALSFLPHAPSASPKEMQEGVRRKRSSTPAAKPRRPPLQRTKSSFAEPPLDGCLGGF
ncbi:hypothetical protein JAAARDRAFT_359314 [Jaapia argillacea MUCL 33604]|uniref:Uncharacterized protein n=1 Tax=Jaapia argillacea MUCL 33604 TaxID=933084 RepID=A0A067Q787_9AGAM|nr:hypothetical protein JAAARDRAFT_359314 [Jaapia argillacea MUCL 33604]